MASTELRAEEEQLRAAVRRVAAVVNSISEAKPAASLKQCGVEEVATGLSLRPPGPVELKKGQALTRRLIISGGKAPYAAELLEHPVKGLTLSHLVPFGPRIVIEATAEAPEGTYTLLVTDAAGNTKTIAVTVK